MISPPAPAPLAAQIGQLGSGRKTVWRGCSVAIGIVSARPAGTIALQDCDHAPAARRIGAFVAVRSTLASAAGRPSQERSTSRRPLDERTSHQPSVRTWYVRDAYSARARCVRVHGDRASREAIPVASPVERRASPSQPVTLRLEGVRQISRLRADLALRPRDESGFGSDAARVWSASHTGIWFR